MSALHTPTSRTITLRTIAANRAWAYRESEADWYEREAADLRASGDCDEWRLAGEYEQYAAELRGLA